MLEQNLTNSEGATFKDTPLSYRVDCTNVFFN